MRILLSVNGVVVVVAEYMEGCALCRLAAGRDRVTRVWYEDEVCVVVDCRTCGVPMVVVKRHVEVAGCRESAHMVRVAKRLFPGGHIDFRKRSIPGHDHFHVR